VTVWAGGEAGTGREGRDDEEEETVGGERSAGLDEEGCRSIEDRGPVGTCRGGGIRI